MKQNKFINEFIYDNSIKLLNLFDLPRFQSLFYSSNRLRNHTLDLTKFHIEWQQKERRKRDDQYNNLKPLEKICFGVSIFILPELQNRKIKIFLALLIESIVYIVLWKWQITTLFQIFRSIYSVVNKNKSRRIKIYFYFDLSYSSKNELYFRKCCYVFFFYLFILVSWYYTYVQYIYVW